MAQSRPQFVAAGDGLSQPIFLTCALVVDHVPSSRTNCTADGLIAGFTWNETTEAKTER
jgi:hypothetical protein